MAVRSTSKTTRKVLTDSPSEQTSQSKKLTISIPNRINVMYVLVTALIVLAFVVGVLLTMVFYLQKGAGTAAVTANTTDTTAAAPVTEPVKVDPGHFPVQGDPNAKLTVIEYADFQCPYCEQWFKNVEPNLIKDYVDTGKVKFYFRNYAFLGQESTDSALASECANEQGKFWDYHDYLYNHQGQENSGTFSNTHLKEFAATLGLNTDQFNTCLDTKKYQSDLDKDISDAGTSGVAGTPTTFIDGMLLDGACPYSSYKNAIDLMLSGKKISISNGCDVSAQ